MFVKICSELNNKPDITVIECYQCRFVDDVTTKGKDKDFRLLVIFPTENTVECKKIKWSISGNMNVYLLNNEGKTIEKIW